MGPVLSAAQRIPRSQRGLVALSAACAVASLIDSPYPALAPLQNLPTLAILGLLVIALRRWPMPTSAVAYVIGFLVLHTLGGRYAYSYVPYEQWAAALGLPSPGAVLGLGRNSYDRVVHFSFGLLLVHPIEAWLTRHGNVRPGLALYIAAEFIFAGSAAYEVFEWLLTMLMAGDDAAIYNGQQGDMWDAQKDMACAAVGAICTTGYLAITRRRR